MQSNLKEPKYNPKLKKQRANRSLDQSFSNKSLQISGNSIKAFDTMPTLDFMSSDVESQQDPLPDAIFLINKSINFPSIDFPTLNEPNSTIHLNSAIKGTSDRKQIKSQSMKSSRKPKNAPATPSVLTTSTKRTGKDKYHRPKLDLTTMNFDALSSLGTNTCLTEKSTNVEFTGWFS